MWSSLSLLRSEAMCRRSASTVLLLAQFIQAGKKCRRQTSASDIRISTLEMPIYSSKAAVFFCFFSSCVRSHTKCNARYKQTNKKIKQTNKHKNSDKSQVYESHFPHICRKEKKLYIFLFASTVLQQNTNKAFEDARNNSETLEGNCFDL